MDDKTKSIVAHLTFIGWIIALVTVQNQTDKGENTSFYLRQNLGFIVLSVAAYIIGMISLWMIYTIVSIVIFVLWVISLLGAISGEKKSTPVVGDMFQQWFKSIS